MRRLVVLGLAALGACGGRPTGPERPAAAVAVRPREFAGFSLDVPTGQVVANTQSYASGEYSIQPADGQAETIEVSWSPGSIDENELEITIVQFRRDGLDVSPALLPGPGGLQVPTVVFNDPAKPEWLSAFECGTRLVYLTTWGVPGDDSAAAHRRIVGSFDCHADPAREPPLGLIRLAIELPHFFTQKDGRYEGQLVLTDGVAMTLTLVEETTGGDVSPSRDLYYVRDVVLEPVVDGRTPYRGVEDGIAVRGFLYRKQCASFSVTLHAQANESHADRLATLVEPIAHARCLEAGETPPTWPDQPPPGKRQLR